MAEDSDGEILEIGIIVVAAQLIEETEHSSDGPKAKKRKNRAPTRDWVQRRKEFIFREFEGEDRKKFIQCFRMSPEVFDKLLGMVWLSIIKADTIMKESIRPKIRLQITLLYISGGGSFGSLENQFRVPLPTISYIIAETTEVLWDILNEKYICCPANHNEWLEVAKGFEVNNQFNV